MRRPRAPSSCGPAVVIAMLVIAVVLSSCGTSHPKTAPPRAADTTTTSRPSPSTSSAPAATVHATTVPATTLPTTTTTRATKPAEFHATVSAVGAADLPSTYRAGCPVGPAQLRMLHMTYWGFDDRPHLGTMVVAAGVTTPVITAFGALFAKRFPIRRMEPVDAFGGSDPASMAADNTSGFNCRNAVASGPPRWSAHAYGTAIDVNPVENPYVEGGAVQPPNGMTFVDRSRVRMGMAEPGGVLNDAFAAVGWQWGGRWSTPDYQHFSANGG